MLISAIAHIKQNESQDVSNPILTWPFHLITSITHKRTVLCFLHIIFGKIMCLTLSIITDYVNIAYLCHALL